MDQIDLKVTRLAHKLNVQLGNLILCSWVWNHR